jgi:WD40 repeat protein
MTASAALLALVLVCASSVAQPRADLPVAKGTTLPQALTSAELRFSAASDKLLVVRQYGEGTAPLLTVHDARPDARIPGRSVFFPLSSPDLIGTAGARRSGVSAEFGPSGNVLVTMSSRTVRLWDISKGQNGRWPAPVTLDLPGSALATFTKDGKQLLTASLIGSGKIGEKAQCEVKLWDVGSGKPTGEPSVATVPAPIRMPPTTMRALLLAHDGSFFLTVAGAAWLDAQSVQLWEAKTLKPIGEPLDVPGSLFSLGSDGKTLLAVSRHEIALWELATRKRVSALPSPPEVAKAWPSSLDGLRSRPWFAIHPNGTSVLCREDDQAKLWDLSGEKPMEKVTLKHPGQVSWIAISHDGKQAATACEQPNEALVWNLETGKPLLKIPLKGKVMAMEFSPDGRLLATADAGDVQLWNLDTKE